MDYAFKVAVSYWAQECLNEVIEDLLALVGYIFVSMALLYAVLALSDCGIECIYAVGVNSEL